MRIFTLKEMQMPKKFQVWTEINLKHFSHNLSLIKQKLNPKTQILLALKADAYGHGALELAKVALKHNVSYFGVARFEEAMELRQKFKKVKILILGYTPSFYVKEAIKEDIELCVYDLAMAKAFSQMACKQNKKALIHIKLDTGMNRIGYQYNQKNLEEIKKIQNLKYVKVQGIFTHFATADNKDLYFEKQFKDFKNFLSSIKVPKSTLLHCANSAAIFNAKKTHLDMVRLGIAAYGLKPSLQMGDLALKAVMSFKAMIVQIKELNKGESVSYGRTFIASKKMKIATLCVGYADGYMRALSNKAEVLIKGKRAKVVGNICMDQCMVDISKIENVKVGDSALLFGYDENNNELSVDELAKHLGTINYELTCAVSKRVKRIYC